MVAIYHLIHNQHKGKINSNVISMTFLDIESNVEDRLMEIFCVCLSHKGLRTSRRSEKKALLKVKTSSSLRPHSTASFEH